MSPAPGRPQASVVTTRQELAERLTDARAGGRSVALVPTMGALHAGHEALVRRASAVADVVVVSVFVNPLQFAAGDDLERYPRSLDADVELAGLAGATLVLAPAVAEVYRAGEPIVRVWPGALGERFEGAARPGHFAGVLTVVLKLLGLVRPDVVVFGAKDAQQLVLVRRMVTDLDVPVRVEAVPTVRDADGLALSSRNHYLDQAGRASALALSRSLRAAGAAAEQGDDAVQVLRAAAAVLAAEPGLDTDYCALVDPQTLADVAPGAPGPALLLVAGRVGGTRLIDAATVELAGGHG